MGSERRPDQGVTGAAELAAVVARVWPDGVDAVEPLGGGITNHNYKVDAGGESFVLRIGGAETELLGIDRAHERDASLVAAGLGIAPDVVSFVEPEGHLVTRFVAGTVGEVSVEEAAGLLRRLHTGPPIPGRFDALAVVDEYAVLARSRGVSLPEAFTQARTVGAAVAARLGRRPEAPCHNDLLAANFISGVGRTWIVDWEYAAMGDPAFDLANFAVSNGLDEEGDAELLCAYGSDETDVHVLMRYLSDFREAMWGVLQQAISTLDFDFETYARDHFERLSETASEPRFRTALTSVQ
jgi:thiamine kinase-like enzyme